MGDRLFRAVSTDNAKVCGAFAGWNGGHRDEEHGVGPGDGGGALGQPMNLGGIGGPPESAIGALAELSVLSEFPSVGVERIAMKGMVLGARWQGRGKMGMQVTEALGAPRTPAGAPGGSGIRGGSGRRGHPQRWRRGR